MRHQIGNCGLYCADSRITHLDYNLGKELANYSIYVGTLQDGYMQSVPLLCIYAGSKQVPRARAATSIQAI